jgi:uncharacterized protein (TIGR02391 family)
MLPDHYIYALAGGALPDGGLESTMTRSKAAPPTLRRSANLSPAQIRSAIPQLELRIVELEDLSAAAITSDRDPQIVGREAKIDGTLARIYGPDTNEYARLWDATKLDDTYYGFPRSINDIQAGVERARQRAIALLTQEVALMKEQLGDDGDNRVDRAIRAYANLDLHPEIARAASELYRNGHYANAIEDAVKALNDLVRMRSGEALDGTALMQKVFSPNAPILRFNPLADQSDKDEQLGFMMMFSGAVAGLRNPRAHKLIKDDPERALEFIAFVSLLAKLLDGTRKSVT